MSNSRTLWLKYELYMAQCIFCGRDHDDETVEHIIPRTLGNIHYILPKGEVCSKCNNRFAKYEHDVLNSSIFLKERKRLGLLKSNNQTIAHDLHAKSLNPFLLKMGYEAIYKSRKKIWREYDFEAVREMLVVGKPLNYLKDNDLSNVVQTKSIPRWFDTFRLGRNHIRLIFSRTDDDRLFIHFHFSSIRAKVRII